MWFVPHQIVLCFGGGDDLKWTIFGQGMTVKKFKGINKSLLHKVGREGVDDSP